MDLPLTFRIERILQNITPIQFEPSIKSRFGIFPRHVEKRNLY